MPTKLKYEFVKLEFEKEGYTVLSKVYKNSQTKLEYICPEGHTHSMKWNFWQRGVRCPYCVNNNLPLTLYKIRACFMSEGYKLLSESYKNAHGYLEYECPKGHKGKIRWANWNIGQRCSTCRYLKRFGQSNPAWRGGTSFEPYCPIWKNVEFKNYIKNRDDNICLNPYCDSKDPNDLVVHHIDYNKKNCSPDNLITVCRSCNFKANKDRRWHKLWYRAIIKNRYS